MERHESLDLKALVDRYGALADPTGEIAFVIADIASECSDFTGRTFDAYLRYYQGNNKPGVRPDEGKRALELRRRMNRCAGIDHAQGSVLYDQMHAKALDLAYPGEVARTLAFKGYKGPHPLLDEMALHFLSEKADGDVIVELVPYLLNRIVPYKSLPQEQSVWHTAWKLVACDFGADCGPGSRLVYKTCLLYGTCDLASAEDALRLHVDEDTLRTAQTLRLRVTAGIRSRDWTVLGF